MASIVYLIRTPKYKELSFKDMQLIDSYFRWRREVERNSMYAAPTFEKWCGHSESELPPIEALLYFKPFFKRTAIDGNAMNANTGCGIFEQVARLPKSSQFLNWFAMHVVKNGGQLFSGPYEVTKEQLELLLEACTHARRYGFSVKLGDQEGDCEYAVNESIAKAILPMMEMNGQSMFPYEYGNAYAKQVIGGIAVINQILATTDFEKQSIFVKYS